MNAKIFWVFFFNAALYKTYVNKFVTIITVFANFRSEICSPSHLKEKRVSKKTEKKYIYISSKWVTWGQNVRDARCVISQQWKHLRDAWCVISGYGAWFRFLFLSLWPFTLRLFGSLEHNFHFMCILYDQLLIFLMKYTDSMV